MPADASVVVSSLCPLYQLWYDSSVCPCRAKEGPFGRHRDACLGPQLRSVQPTDKPLALLS